MSEMKERVAKAVQETAQNMGSYFDRFVAAEVARAAIEAMREPSKEMIEAMERLDGAGDHMENFADGSGRWVTENERKYLAATDAALAD